MSEAGSDDRGPPRFAHPTGICRVVILAREAKVPISLRHPDVVPILRTMTPQEELKHEVGVREFHDHLSRYVRHVVEGGEVVVTMRGKRVARLAPVDRTDPVERLRARGLVSDPSRRWAPRPRGRASATSPVSDLVPDQRR